MPLGPELSVQRRWEIVRQRLRDEARKASLETKMAQLDALIASVDEMGWRAALSEDDASVRTLWTELRAAWSRGQSA